MSIFNRIIIGQEAVVPQYGLGRVVSFKNDASDKYIEIQVYIGGARIVFDPDNVRLIKLTYDHGSITENG